MARNITSCFFLLTEQEALLPVDHMDLIYFTVSELYVYLISTFADVSIFTIPFVSVTFPHSATNIASSYLIFMNIELCYQQWYCGLQHICKALFRLTTMNIPPAHVIVCL